MHIISILVKVNLFLLIVFYLNFYHILVPYLYLEL